MKRKRIGRKFVALLVALSLLVGTFISQVTPASVVQAASPTSYTVSLNEAYYLFLGNKTTTTSGSVTLSYTVESATITPIDDSNNGVVATTDTTAERAYSKGMMWFDGTTNQMMVEGRSYQITMSLNNANVLTYEVKYTDADGKSGTISFEAKSAETAVGAQYFGIYVSQKAKAKLTNVTCVGADGSDLGLQVDSKNSSKCQIFMDIAENVVKHTVTLTSAAEIFLSNKAASSETVILNYTVESENMAAGNNGISSATNPTGNYPYTSQSQGRLYFAATNLMMVANRTYQVIMNLDSNNVLQYTINYMDADGTSGSIKFAADGKAGADVAAQYFGIWIAPESVVTAKLTNVSCINADGTNLGLQANKSTCKIEENIVEVDEDAVKYTVLLNKSDNLFLSNKKAVNGSVILSYTVESVTDHNAGDPQNGLIATKTPLANYPFTEGSGGTMQFNSQGGYPIWKEGYTYQIKMSLNASGNLQYTINYTDKEGNPGTTTFSESAGGTTAKGAQYFGIWLSRQMTAKLTNVTCVDAGGNDMGLQVNTHNTNLSEIKEAVDYTNLSFRDYRKDSTGVKLDEAVEYTVELENTQFLFMGNKIATSGPITLNYTVESATKVSGDENNTGVIATTNPTVDRPYHQVGTMAYEGGQHTMNMMEPGCTYAVTIGLGSDGKVTYSGKYTDRQGQSKDISMQETINSAVGSKYFGIWVSQVVNSAKLTNVTCVNADGSDLGLRVNQVNGSKCTITKSVDKNVAATSVGDTAVFTHSVDGLDEVKFAGKVTFTTADANGTQSIRIGGSKKDSDKTWYGIGLHLSDKGALIARNWYTSSVVETTLGTGFAVNQEIPVALAFEKEGDGAWAVEYSVNGKYVATVHYSDMTGDFGNYMLIQNGITYDSTGALNPVKELSAISYDLDKDGNYLVAGNSVVKDAEGNVVTLDTTNPVLTEEGVYTILTTYGSFQYSRQVTLTEGGTASADTSALTFDYIGGDEVMPIVGYCGPYKNSAVDYINDDVFQKIKDSGVNLINCSFNRVGEGNSANVYKVLQLTEKYGIGYFVSDARLNPEFDDTLDKYIADGKTLTTQEVADLIGDYSYFESYLGHHVVDEPYTNTTTTKTDRLWKYFDWTANALNTYANTLGFVNAFGTNTTGTDVYPKASLFGGTTYKNFLADVADNGAKVLSFDIYPFDQTGGVEDKEMKTAYFYSLSQTREVSLEKNIPFWSYVQAGGNFTTSETVNKEAIPTEAETYWNVNTALAFGAKGIEWFPLVQPAEFGQGVDGNETDRNGLIAKDGSETTYYDWAKSMNMHIAAVDEVLMKAESTGIIATGTTPKSVLNSSKVTLSNTTSKLNSVSTSDNTEGAIVGCFDYGNTEAFYAMNYDVNQSTTMSMVFNADYNYHYVVNGEEYSGTGSNLAVEVGAGEAILVVLDEKISDVNGDANGDGVVNVADIVRYKKVLANVESVSFATNFDADLNGDGKNDDKDVAWIRKYLVN